MSRTARRLSSSGIYHVMIRGNEKKDIFYDDRDRKKFLNAVSKVIKVGGYALYAYCLMKNHVHMLVREEDESIQKLMRSIEISYAHYFNKKYERVGHLFQDRFRSEAVEGDQYLLMAARYIHNNPVKAGLVAKPSEYEWSSFNSYIGENTHADFLIEKAYLLAMFSNDSQHAIKKFLEFTVATDEDQFLDCSEDEEPTGNRDMELQLLNILKERGMELGHLKRCADKKLRNLILNDIKQNINISIRELSDITGISKDIILRA